MGISGIMNTLFMNKAKLKWGPYVAYSIAALTILFFYIYVAFKGEPSRSIIGNTSANAGAGTSYSSLFILGLIAGCVSFGGAVNITHFFSTYKWYSTRLFLSYTPSLLLKDNTLRTSSSWILLPYVTCFLRRLSPS